MYDGDVEDQLPPSSCLYVRVVGGERGEEWGATVPLYGGRWRRRSAPLLRVSVSIAPREGKRSYRERTCALGKSVLVTLHR